MLQEFHKELADKLDQTQAAQDEAEKSKLQSIYLPNIFARDGAFYCRAQRVPEDEETTLQERVLACHVAKEGISQFGGRR